MGKGYFEGLYPALVTPFDKNGKVNEHTLLKLVDRLLEQETDGLYLMGSTAEAFMMSTQERINTVALLTKHIDGKCKVVVQVGALSTEEAVMMAKSAYEYGADMVSAVAPFYYTHSFSELEKHFLTIAESTPLPFLLYNFPGFSGVEYSVKQLNRLMESPSIIGVKYTDLNLYKLERIRKMNPKALLFNGHDEVYLAAIAMGVDNAIGSTFNIMLPKFKSIRRLANNSQFDLALKEQQQANDIIDILIKVGVLPGIKYILNKMGYEVGECNKPFSSLDAEKQLMLDSVFEILKPIY